MKALRKKGDTNMINLSTLTLILETTNDIVFMGYFIAALATIVSITVPILTLVFNRSDKRKESSSQSSSRLETKIDNLDTALQEMNLSTKLLAKNVEVLGDKINENNRKEVELEQKINLHSETLVNHEERIKVLENKDE